VGKAPPSTASCKPVAWKAAGDTANRMTCLPPQPAEHRLDVSCLQEECIPSAASRRAASHTRSPQTRCRGPQVLGSLSVRAVGRRQVLIDWDWGASGIWSVRGPDEDVVLSPGSTWGPHVPPSDRHQAWRGLLSDELIDELQAWNDHGDIVMGRNAHRRTEEERVAFWARGRQLAERVQQQLGHDYEVICDGGP
jgi:hypothetical protein